ncbi:DUF3426 domain-containing protein [Comamonas sp. 17RB]|uniref:DUF3426 domain-containing protein n=1 Tax=Comamonas sp. 17RB TaxID=3047025 RepID=UPI0024B6DCB7|nr:DUF3426 domain-containing protein [Comamonas sp. 17RB]MDI9854522.1 DUF3426 domain-containing protein [Comamonas sp. 17RB]
MSQITTCPSCSTRFRVVADQLRISDGWVRCGQCQEVFDARDHLDAVVPVEPVAAPEPVPAAPAVPDAVAHTGVAGASAVPAVQAMPMAPVAEEVVTEPEGEEPSLPVPDMPVPASEPVPAPVVPPAPGYELPAPQWSDDPDLPEPPAAHEEPEPEAVLPLRPSHAAVEPDHISDPEPVLQLPSVAPAAPASGRTDPVWNASAAAPAEVTRQEPSASAEALTDAWSAADHQGLQGTTPAQDGRSDAEPVAPTSVQEAMDRVDASTPVLAAEAADAAEVAAHAAEPVDAGAAMPPPVDAIESAAQKLAQSEAAITSAAAPAFPFAEPVDDDDPLVLDSSLEPGFVRDARRKAWWQKPVVRVAMGASVVVLPVALVLQVALHERNALAAWQPSLRPALEFMCTALQCKLGPRQQIGAMVVSGSTFAKGERERAYQLSLSIQNRAGTPVGMPAVELTLTDAQDQAIARKVIQAKELGAPPELKAGAEWSGTVPVTTEGLNLQVSGYRVLLFYP